MLNKLETLDEVLISEESQIKFAMNVLVEFIRSLGDEKTDKNDLKEPYEKTFQIPLGQPTKIELSDKSEQIFTKTFNGEPIDSAEENLLVKALWYFKHEKFNEFLSGKKMVGSQAQFQEFEKLNWDSIVDMFRKRYYYKSLLSNTLNQEESNFNEDGWYCKQRGGDELLIIKGSKKYYIVKEVFDFNEVWIVQDSVGNQYLFHENKGILSDQGYDWVFANNSNNNSLNFLLKDNNKYKLVSLDRNGEYKEIFSFESENNVTKIVLIKNIAEIYDNSGCSLYSLLDNEFLHKSINPNDIFDCSGFIYFVDDSNIINLYDLELGKKIQCNVTGLYVIMSSMKIVRTVNGIYILFGNSIDYIFISNDGVQTNKKFENSLFSDYVILTQIDNIDKLFIGFDKETEELKNRFFIAENGIIDLETGKYYKLSKTGQNIWRLNTYTDKNGKLHYTTRYEIKDGKLILYFSSSNFVKHLTSITIGYVLSGITSNDDYVDPLKSKIEIDL